MNLLALDTSTPVCAIALRAGELTFYETVQAGNTHSQLALPMIEAILKEAEISFDDLDAVAFGSGPGSFTGVRIACALAQGIAFAHGKKVVPVPTLLSVAHTCALTVPEAAAIWVANDARMNEAYCAGYVRDARGVWVEHVPVRVCAPRDAMPPAGFDWVLAGDAFAVYPAMLNSPPPGGKGLGERVFAAMLNGESRQPPSPQPSPPGGGSIIHALTAEGLLAASLASFHAGVSIHPREAEPLYVRNKVASTEKEREIERAQKKAAA